MDAFHVFLSDGFRIFDEEFSFEVREVSRNDGYLMASFYHRFCQIELPGASWEGVMRANLIDDADIHRTFLIEFTCSSENSYSIQWVNFTRQPSLLTNSNFLLAYCLDPIFVSLCSQKLGNISPSKRRCITPGPISFVLSR